MDTPEKISSLRVKIFNLETEINKFETLIESVALLEVSPETIHEVREKANEKIELAKLFIASANKTIHRLKKQLLNS